MNSVLAVGYKSRSQIARIVTEHWAAGNLYCTACDHPAVVQSPNNARAVDFTCPSCEVAYQLKSGERWNEKRIPDAGYDSMIKAIRGDNVPNLLVMQYSTEWRVQNLLLVPSFFFSEAAIEKRKPLSSGARRAGWIGCNILLSEIPPEGKIRLIRDGIPSTPESVRRQYKKIKPLANLKASLRGWALSVLRIVHIIGKSPFMLHEVYAFERELSELYPGNEHVRPKIRQQLQVLRDAGLIEFLGRGTYGIREQDVNSPH